MPDLNLSEAQREAFAVARRNDPTLETVEISNPDHPTSFYLVRDSIPRILTLETLETVTFEPVNFRLSRPKQGETGSQELTLTVDNVDRRIFEFLEAIQFSQQETKIKWRLYLESDDTQPQTTVPVELTIVDIAVTTFEVTATARFIDILNKPFPNENFTRARFPSLGS
jgi:hypothetical protein